MFTQPCFIRKNTPELRKKLEELGYTNGAWESPHFEYPYLKCFPNRKFGLFNGEGFYITEDDYKCDGKQWTYNPPKEYIDCGTNEELFLALAALRDDSPINSYYWFNNKLVMCYSIFDLNINQSVIYRFHSMDNPKIYFPFNIDMMRKATIKEIIEHFK